MAEAEFKVEAELVAISTNLLAVELGTVPFRDSGTQVLAQPTAAADALEALHLRLSWSENAGDPVPSARRVPPVALAAPTHPRSPPGQLESLRWPEQLASSRP